MNPAAQKRGLIAILKRFDWQFLPEGRWEPGEVVGLFRLARQVAGCE
jgi:hypothetical protein